MKWKYKCEKCSSNCTRNNVQLFRETKRKILIKLLIRQLVLRKYHRFILCKRANLFKLHLHVTGGKKECRSLLINGSEVRYKSANGAKSGYRKAAKRKWTREDTLQLSVLPVIPRSHGRFNIDSENIRNLSARAGRCRDRESSVHSVFI